MLAILYVLMQISRSHHNLQLTESVVCSQKYNNMHLRMQTLGFLCIGQFLKLNECTNFLFCHADGYSCDIVIHCQSEILLLRLQDIGLWKARH